MSVRTWSNQLSKALKPDFRSARQGVSPSEIWALFFAAVRDEFNIGGFIP